MKQTIQIRYGDSFEILKGFEEGSVGAVVCDPPYGLSFMGKSWDDLDDNHKMQSWHEGWLRECYRVLKPGGVIKAFSGTRTFHRLATAMESVGFVLDPKESLTAWVYACLSDDTEILTKEGWVHYHKSKVGTHVLGFDLKTGCFSWQPVEETFEYPYDQEAFHIIGEGTDHIVTPKHRVIVQRDGIWCFQFAEDLEATETVPSMQPDIHPQEGYTDILQSGMCESSQNQTKDPFVRTQGEVCSLYSLRKDEVVSRCMATQGQATDMLQAVQRDSSRASLGVGLWPQGVSKHNPRVQGTGCCEDDRIPQPSMEGGCDILQEARELCQARADQVCSVSPGTSVNGTEGRICDGTSLDSSSYSGKTLIEDGDCASLESQPSGQQIGEPSAICIEQGSQIVRASWVPTPTLARIEPTHYTGTVWCVRVPTGAFVARRNGLIFITGNSGFPKSLSVSKAIDSHMRHGKSDPRYISETDSTRPVVGHVKRVVSSGRLAGNGETEKGVLANRERWLNHESKDIPVTAPATEEAKRFEGYGTALKPAFEPIICGRKPLI